MFIVAPGKATFKPGDMFWMRTLQTDAENAECTDASIFRDYCFLGSGGWAFKQLLVLWVNPILPPRSLRLPSKKKNVK